jgi:hypothetical protein
VYNEDSLPVSTIEPYKFQQKFSVTYTFETLQVSLKSLKTNLLKRCFLSGTYKVRNEIETKRNETKSTKTKRNQRNENEIKRNQRKKKEINENKTK